MRVQSTIVAVFLLKTPRMLSLRFFLPRDLLSACIFQSVGRYFLCVLPPLLPRVVCLCWSSALCALQVLPLLCWTGDTLPFVPKQAATVISADPRPWKMASIIWGPVCSWQFGKLDSSGHWDKSLWGTKDVLLRTFSLFQQLLGGLSPAIARVEIHTVLKI